MPDEPFNIVPPQHVKTELYDPASPTVIQPGTKLTYRGGPLLRNVKVVAIYYGNTFPPDLATSLTTFLTYIVTSPLIDQLAEYSVNEYTIGHGEFISEYHVQTDVQGSSIADQDIQNLLFLLMDQLLIPEADENTLYFVYLPSGITVTQPSGDASCEMFCGYHDVVPFADTYYAVMPFPDCAGCRGDLNILDALTAVSTHELCEAITDPVPGTGWYDDANGEIGDICAWQNGSLEGHEVQLEWSNAKGACVLGTS